MGRTFSSPSSTPQNTRIVQVEPGDAIYIDVGNRAGLLDDKTRRRRAVISCRPVVPLPRKYDEVLLAITGSGSIRSLGFTGLTNRSPYALFDSLPWDGAQEFPNPDNVVTVQDSGSSEFVLIRTRAIGDPVPALPGNTEWYGGQVLNGSLTFRFYTSREDQGAHGEMDLWRTNPVSNFPTYFGAGPYRALQLCSPMSHVASAVGDTSRNSLRAIADLSSNHWPREYVAGSGERVVSTAEFGTIQWNDKVFVQVGTDSGISKQIVPANQVVNFGDYWLTENDERWRTSDDQDWTT
jgi:hypothetical protein